MKRSQYWPLTDLPKIPVGPYTRCSEHSSGISIRSCIRSKAPYGPYGGLINVRGIPADVSDGGARFGISDSIGPSISCVGFIVSDVCGPSMLNSECPGRGCGTNIPVVSALSQARRMPFHTAKRVLPEHTRETRR
jgi:hypothetical protein